MIEILIDPVLWVCAAGLAWSTFQVQRYRYTRKLMSELPHMIWVSFDEVISSCGRPGIFARLALTRFAKKKIAETRIANKTPDRVKRLLLGEIHVRVSTAAYYEYRILKKYPRRPKRVERTEVKESEWSGLPVSA